MKQAEKGLKDLSLEEKIEKFKAEYEHNRMYNYGIDSDHITELMNYLIVSDTVRNSMMENWVKTQADYSSKNCREVYYLSLEFLIGRLLSNNVINLGLEDVVKGALKDSRYDWEATKNFEHDAGLGNGGLGRLAACFIDSMATMGIPNKGYGLRYDYGIFKQNIVNGCQIEEPDNWLRYGYPWEFRRSELEQYVQFGGTVTMSSFNGREEWRWLPNERVKGIPFDIPVVGFGGKTVNTLRLWSAFADNEFNLEEFNRGSYIEAVEKKVRAENLTKVLYPNDNTEEGKELRLRQQYFFVACTVHDVLRLHKQRGNNLNQMKEKVFFQLNDTHPTLVIPELMRILMDEEGMGWEQAWDICSGCVGYTNHTVLPEALEKWSIGLFERLLPRHTQIIYEINARFLKHVGFTFPGDSGKLRKMSLIEEEPVKAVRMANLAVVGASKVNGVAKIHSDILRESIFSDFAQMWPEKFTNVTNGITQRRWLLNANPRLAALITEKIGSGWITDLYQLKKLENFINDKDFMTEYASIKQENKQKLADFIYNTQGIKVNPNSIFDVQIKRLHEYKRQFLLALYIIMLYNRLIENPGMEMEPHTFIFSGKAAPGYVTAKLVIRLIHAIAEAVNSNPVSKDKLKVIFLPNYSVSLAEQIIPAADVSEQISLAGTEASGTGNMKLMLNGAITLGTMDGANVEICQEVGKENIFIFGMSAEEVTQRRKNYSPIEICREDEEIRKVVLSLQNDTFSVLTPGLFEPLVKTLTEYGDHYMQLADLRSYSEAQNKVQTLFKDKAAWSKISLLNVARSGKFSSDRTIAEYARNIWKMM